MYHQRRTSSLILLLATALWKLPPECTSARVLFYQGIAVSYSHQIGISPLLDLLAKQGHQVTFFSPYKYVGTGNVTQVSMDHFVKANRAFSAEINRLATTVRIYDIKPPLFAFFLNCYAQAKKALESQEYTNWLKKSQFDLVIFDGAGDEVIYAMANVWKARVIRYMPWSGLLHFDGPLFNIPSEDVSGFPIISGFFPEEGQELCVFKKMINYVHRLTTSVVFDHLYTPGIDRLIRQHGLVAPASPPLRQLIPQVTDLVLVTWDGWSHFSRPLLPNVITLSPMVVHLVLKTKPLPKDIQDFIGSDDFIYVSFGTFVDPKLFPEHLTDALFEGLGEIPLKVLFKWDDLERPNVPPNIMLRKFYPQVDVLAHSNIKLYFQHGGFNGFLESIVHKVPSAISPVVVDMELNAFVAAQKGFGKTLNIGSLTKESVRDTILEVLNNKSYKETVEKYGAISRQDDRNTRATALKLINRLLNGEDLQHLKSGNSGQSIWAKESLDVFALIFFLVYGTVAISLYGCYCGFRRCYPRNKMFTTQSSDKKDKVKKIR